MNSSWYSTLLTIALLSSASSQTNEGEGGDLQDESFQDPLLNLPSTTTTPPDNENCDDCVTEICVAEDGNCDEQPPTSTEAIITQNDTDSIVDGEETTSPASWELIRYVNLTDFFIAMFDSKKEKTSLEKVKEGENWRACYACYRLSSLVGPNRVDRKPLADTCGRKSEMPKTRCLPVRPSHQSNISIEGGYAIPSCAKSYIRQNFTELIIYGCYSPYLLTDQANKGPPGPPSKPSKKKRNVPVQRCQNGFGKGVIGLGNTNLSIWTFCCDNDLCNRAAGSPLFFVGTQIKLITFGVPIIIIYTLFMKMISYFFNKS